MEVSLKLVATLLLVPLVLGGAVYLAGWLLSPVCEGRATVLISTPPEKVLSVIADVVAQPDWREDVSRVVRSEDGWDEITTRGETIRFVVERMDAARVSLRFTSDAGYGGTWEAVLSTEADGTRVDVMERVEIPSPIGRLVSRLMFDPEEFANTYLARLKARSEGE